MPTMTVISLAGRGSLGVKGAISMAIGQVLSSCVDECGGYCKGERKKVPVLARKVLNSLTCQPRMHNNKPMGDL